MNTSLQAVAPLATETRSALPTDEAAIHLNRKQQTLRIWACRENGPIRPIRINGRLAWPVAELRRLVGCTDKVSHERSGDIYDRSTMNSAARAIGGAK